MKKIMLIGLMFLLILMPMALAQYDWDATCIGDELIKNKTIVVGTESIPITDNTTCPYGCDAGRRECTDYSGPPGTAVPLLLFLAVEVVALMLLAWSFIGAEVLQKLISAVLAAILLFPLGLLSFNVLVDGVAMVFTWLAWLNFVMGFLAVIMVIYAMLQTFNEDMT